MVDAHVVAEDGTPEALAQVLQDALRAQGVGDERVVLTNNRVRLVSVQRRPRRPAQVRVARRLLSLGPDVVPTIASFAHGSPEAHAALRRVIATLPPLPPGPRRRASLRPVGDHHDLRPIAGLEAARLDIAEPPAVSWGSRRRLRRPQRTMRLGSYVPSVPYVRVHRALDHPAVPTWYLGFVIFHELLHHQLGRAWGPREQGRGRAGRWHHEAFRRAEEEHPRFREARRWEGVNVPRLLTGRAPLPWEG